MARIRVTKEFHFEAAHFLPGYDGLCANLHGHSYRLLVTLRGEILKDATSPKNGMVIDFSVLKGIVERNILQVLDHSLIVRKHTYDLPATCTHFRILELDVCVPPCPSKLSYFVFVCTKQLPVVQSGL